MKKAFTLVLTSFILSILFPLFVTAKTCWFCNIKVSNMRYEPIRVLQISYWDKKVNRYRHKIGIPNVIMGRDFKNFKYNLQFVGKKETYVRIVYQYALKARALQVDPEYPTRFKWDKKKYYALSKKEKCNNRMWIDITVTDKDKPL